MMKYTQGDAQNPMSPNRHSMKYLWSKLLPSPPDIYPGTPASGTSQIVPVFMDRDDTHKEPEDDGQPKLRL